MIVTLAGSNDFMIENELKSISSNFKDKHGEFAVEQIDGSETDYQSIFESASNLSLLSPNKLIIIKRGSSNKIFIDSIEQVIKNTPSTNDLIIVEPSVDKRLNYFKVLKRSTDFRSYDELDLRQLVHWINETVSKHGGIIKNSIAAYLIEIAGMNQMRLSNEIIKLISYQNEVTKETIDLLVEPLPQTTIFQLLDAAFSGRNKDLLKIYDDQKKQKVEPQQIVAMLTWQIHILALIKAAGNNSPAEIARQTKISPFVISKSFDIAKKLSLENVKDLTTNLLELDIKLKSKSVDIDEALLQLLLSIRI